MSERCVIDLLVDTTTGHSMYSFMEVSVAIIKLKCTHTTQKVPLNLGLLRAICTTLLYLLDSKMLEQLTMSHECYDMLHDSLEYYVDECCKVQRGP